MAMISHLLFTAVGYITHLFMVIILFPSLTQADSYELIYMTDSTTEMSGSITMQCRDAFTAEPLEINDRIKFWLNRTSACDLDIRARAAVQVDDYSIKLNLTHNLDGIYTCGRLIVLGNEVTIEESNPITLICKLKH